MKLSDVFTVFCGMLGLTLTFLISTGLARGQDGNAGQSRSGYSGAPNEVDTRTIDDTTLKQTAKAYVKVRQIVQNAQQDLNNSGDDTSKQQQIVKQAESEKIAVVQAEGLRPQQYNQVIQLARVDKSFQQRFFSYVDKEKRSPGGNE
jgi:hypothetical protein